MLVSPSKQSAETKTMQTGRAAYCSEVQAWCFTGALGTAVHFSLRQNWQDCFSCGVHTWFFTGLKAVWKLRNVRVWKRWREEVGWRGQWVRPFGQQRRWKWGGHKREPKPSLILFLQHSLLSYHMIPSSGSTAVPLTQCDLQAPAHLLPAQASHCCLLENRAQFCIQSYAAV